VGQFTDWLLPLTALLLVYSPPLLIPVADIVNILASLLSKPSRVRRVPKVKCMVLKDTNVMPSQLGCI
jgi:hypothetical protein